MVLHGGPGAASSPEHRRAFDPDRYRIVQVDQRGCGGSTPIVDGPDVDLTANTTWHLVADIERLRAHLGIERWQVFGGSWGSTLALAYAERHREQVTELIIRAVFTARRSEIDWFFGGGIAAVRPQAWDRLLAPIAASGRPALDPLQEYADLLCDPDPAIRSSAAVAWVESESMCVNAEPSLPAAGPIGDCSGAYAVARLEHHYFVHRCWLTEAQLLRETARIADLPTVIVQGQKDVLTPPVAALDLHHSLSTAELELVDAAGHAFEEPSIADALVKATDRFATR